MLCAWAQQSCSRHGDGWPACGERLTWHGCLLRGFLRCERLLEKRHGVWGGELTPTWIPPAIDRSLVSFFPLGWAPLVLVHGPTPRSRAAQPARCLDGVGNGADPGVSFGLRRCQPYPVGRPVLALKKNQCPEHWLRAGLVRRTRRNVPRDGGEAGIARKTEMFDLLFCGTIYCCSEKTRQEVALIPTHPAGPF